MATKVSKNLITSVDPSQITVTGATAGQVLTYNASTTTWVASAVPNPTATTGGFTAWVNFDGTKDTTGAVSTANTNRLIRGSYNVSSVLRNSLGDYTVNFTNALTNTNYAVICTGVSYTSTNTSISHVIHGSIGSGATTKTTTAIRVESGATNAAVMYDSADFNVLIVM